MSTGGGRESSTARSSAALQAAIDATRARFADIEARTAERVCRINDSRLGVMRLLAETSMKMRDRTTAARKALRSTEARRRSVARMTRRQLRGIRLRILALRIRTPARRVFKWVVVALLAAWCVWWGVKFWGEMDRIIRSLMSDNPPAQQAPPPRRERLP